MFHNKMDILQNAMPNPPKVVMSVDVGDPFVYDRASSRGGVIGWREAVRMELRIGSSDLLGWTSRMRISIDPHRCRAS